MANILPIRNSFRGGLNKDLDPLAIQEQDYVDALNVQFLTDKGGQTISIMPVIGNKLAFDIGTVTAHNKKYRLKFPNGLVGSFVARTYLIDGITPYLNNPVYFNDLTDFQVNFGAEVANSGKSWTTTVNNTEFYIDFEITTDLYYDWHLDITGTTGIELYVIEEPIDPSLSGVKYIIGSDDLFSDLFIFSTTKTDTTLDVSISNILDNGSGAIRIVTSSNHNLQTYEYVKISGTPSLTGANGWWQVNVINSTTFDLILSTFTANATVGTVFSGIYGYGEIGVAQYNQSLDTWSYTRLLGSRELGFTTKHQVEVDAEINTLGKSLYFHQVKYNPPKVFYYNQDYVTDGGLSVFGGRYDYGVIAEELNLIPSNADGRLEFIGQDNIGGNLLSGNKIYAVRLATKSDDLAFSPIFSYTKNISVFPLSNDSNPYKVIGGSPSQVTSKVNKFTFTGYNTDLYSFYEFIVFELSGGAVNGKIIERNQLTGTSIDLRHSGFETGVRDLSLDEIFQFFQKIEWVGSQTIIDNRLVFANIKTRQNYDLSEWAESFTHELEVHSIDTIGTLRNPQVGEYIDVLNIYNKTSHVFNETYRYGIEVDWINGGSSSVFWIDDIKIDGSATNITTPNRRTSGLSGSNVTGSVFSVRFGNIDLDYLVDGLPVRDLIRKFRIVRVDLERNEQYREVLATGVAVAAVSGYYASYKRQGTTPGFDDGLFIGRGATSGEVNYFEFPFASGCGQIPTFSSQIPINQSDLYNWDYFVGSDDIGTSLYRWFPRLDVVSFYSPDIIYGNTSIEYQAGDKLVNFGFARLDINSVYTTTDSDTQNPPYKVRDVFDFSSNIREYRSDGLSLNPIEIDINDAHDLSSESDVDLNIGKFTKKIRAFEAASSYLDVGFINAITNDDTVAVITSLLNVGETTHFNTRSLVLELNGLMGNVAGNVNNLLLFGGNNGVYYVQYYREKSNYSSYDPDQSKYGARRLTQYSNIGYEVEITESTPTITTSDSIFGDCFNQKTIIKNRYIYESPTISGGNYAEGFAGALTYYSQNRVNSQLYFVDSNSTSPSYPTTVDRESEWLEGFSLDQLNYNSCYNIRTLKTLQAFDENTVYDYEMPSRILYSNLKQENSFIDTYRVFPPLQFKDLPLMFGEIVHIDNINSELFVWQPRNWQREFFNTTGILSTNDGELSILGNAGVLSRKGVKISSYGTTNKWSVVKGKSRGGGDNVYWIDAENGLVLRYGADGTNNISLMWGMFAFFKNGLNWVYKKDTPADGIGICGVWDDKYQQTIWTVRGYRDVNFDWEPGLSVVVGDTTIDQNSKNYSTFEQFPDIYVCIESHTSSSDNRPGIGANWETYWQLIDHSNTEYYNQYSVVLSEIKNKFTTFISPKPKIYLPFRNTYLTPHPLDDYSNLVYIDNKGDYNTWYENGDIIQSEDGHIESIINYDPQLIKTFSAIMATCDVAPYRIEYTTKDHKTYSIESDFELREGNWIGTIQNDILTSSTGLANDEDTSQLYGNYCKVKFFFEKGEFQKIYAYILRLQGNSRYANT